jgi:hypothetical protein
MKTILSTKFVSIPELITKIGNSAYRHSERKRQVFEIIDSETNVVTKISIESSVGFYNENRIEEMKRLDYKVATEEELGKALSSYCISDAIGFLKWINDNFIERYNLDDGYKFKGVDVLGKYHRVAGNPLEPAYVNESELYSMYLRNTHKL